MTRLAMTNALSRYLLVMSLACVAAAPLAAQKRIITHEDVYLMKRVGEPIVSPDGRLVVFSVTEPDYDPARQTVDLWVVPADGSAPARRLTSTRAAESSPVFSPDSTRLAFSTRREGDEAAQIYILPLNGGEGMRVTFSSRGASTPQWRPDGKAILFESMVPAAPAITKKYNARVYETFPVRIWNAWLEDAKPHVFVQELLEGAAARDVLAGTQLAASKGFDGLSSGLGADKALHAIWTPDGRAIVFAAMVNAHESMYAEVESHLFRVAAGGGEPDRLTKPGHSYTRPRYSPGAGVLFAQYQRSSSAGRIYSLTRLARFDSAGTMAGITDRWDRSVTNYGFSPDGGTIYVEAEDEGFDKFFRVASSGGSVELLFPVKEGGYNNPFAVPGGLIGRYGSSVQPAQIARIDPASGAHRLLTNFDADRVASLDWKQSEHFWFTAKNGKRIHNLLTYPPRFDPSKKYPLVVFPHGGPNAMSKDQFSTRWNFHLLVSQGYVLLQTNYTGSTGFGEKFADDIERDVLRGPALECLEAIEVAAKRYPFIDQARQAAIGASYGGYLMNWFNGHTTQFRCLVNHAGAVNNESQYGVNDGGYGRELRMGVPIWERGGQWMDQSPIRYANKFKTPTLITQGELDFRVPFSESMTTYKLLQRTKVPTRLVIFPDEGHWILKGENSRFHMQEVLSWLKRYLEPEQAVSP